MQDRARAGAVAVAKLCSDCLVQLRRHKSFSYVLLSESFAWLTSTAPTDGIILPTLHHIRLPVTSNLSYCTIKLSAQPAKQADAVGTEMLKPHSQQQHSFLAFAGETLPRSETTSLLHGNTKCFLASGGLSRMGNKGKKHKDDVPTYTRHSCSTSNPGQRCRGCIQTNPPPTLPFSCPRPHLLLLKSRWKKSISN